MNNDFKYILEPYKGPSTRHICPLCQEKRQFTLYIDQHTGQPLVDNVGLCNRAVNCGYHYTPKQFFQDNKEFIPNALTTSAKAKPQTLNPKEQKPISIISLDTLVKTLKAYDQNHFAQFLVKRLGNKIAEEIVGLYYLGTSRHWKGATIFWQIDIEGRTRSGKVMLYDSETGKRIKEPFPHINWIHKIANYKDYNLNQCLFGEHLLSLYPKKETAIVESEKTAMLCAGHIPEINWLASGNLNNLSAKRLQCLKGKKITLYPDAGAFRIWKAKAEQLKDITSFTVSDLIETRATPEQLKKGYDMADYLTDPPVKSVSRKEYEQSNIATKEYYTSPGKAEYKTINDGIIIDSFFDEVKTPKTKESLEGWRVEELEDFFNNATLPNETIQLSSSCIIKDVRKFIESNLNIVKYHNGKEVYLSYFDRLNQLKKYLLNKNL